MGLIAQVPFGLINGLVWGAVLGLISSGLNVIFGLLGIVNVAHGSFYMLGAFLAWFISNHLGIFWPALLIVPLATGLLGLVVEFALKPVERNTTLTVLGTFGVMLGLQGASLLIWGGTPKRLAPPLSAGFSVFGAGYSWYRIIVAVISILILLSLWYCLERTKFGLKLRAVKENPELSVAVGVPVTLIYTLGFGLGTSLAGLSGALVAPMVSITPEMGVRIFAIVFLVVIVGGLGRLWNSVLAAIGFSVIRGLLTIFIDPTGALIITFVLVLGVVFLGPRLFRSLEG